MSIICPRCTDTQTTSLGNVMSCPRCRANFRIQDMRLVTDAGPEPSPPWSDDLVLVIGFPRSGTSLASFLVGRAMGRRVTGPWGVDCGPRVEPPGSPIGVVHNHEMIRPEPTRLLLVVRHWAECGRSHWERTNGVAPWPRWVARAARMEGSVGYGTGLAAYRGHAGPKAVLRYRDLVRRPQEAMEEALAGLGLPGGLDWAEECRRFRPSYRTISAEGETSHWRDRIPPGELQAARIALRSGLGDRVIEWFEGDAGVDDAINDLWRPS